MTEPSELFDEACWPEFYPKVLRHHGDTLANVVAARAYTSWRRERYRDGYIRLANWIAHHQYEFGGPRLPIEAGYRLADRIIQRARAAGLIRPVKPRGWEAAR